MKQQFYNFRRALMVTLASMLISTSIWAQSPQRMSYQAVIRNSSSALVTNTQVGMQVSILQGSVTGTVVYTETLTPTTNANGLVSLEIGGGAGFDAIDWANGPYFFKTETDPTGGTNYTISGVSQLLSVPYALHAKTAEKFIGTLNETDPLFTVWDKSTGIIITESQISDLKNYVEIENQSLADVAAIGNSVNTQLKNVTNPTDAQDAATKSYVDSQIAILLARIEVLERQNVATLPTVTTVQVSEITQTTAISGGEVTLDGNAVVTSRGVVYSKLENPTLELNDGFTEDGEDLGLFESSLTNLSPKTIYYLRAYATNKAGTAYGDQVQFETLPFTYTLSLIANPTDGGTVTGAGIFEENAQIVLTATPNDGFSFVSWTNGETELSTNNSFTFTMPAGSVTLTANFEVKNTGAPIDVDGNVYPTVVIGTQEWMTENLKTTKYRDGSPITTGLNDSQWYSTTTGAYSIYPYASINGLGSDAEVLQAYGALYNRYAVNTGNLCPTGWHIPTLEEYTTLANFLGGVSVAGGKLKSTRTAPATNPFWASPNIGATNEVGFSALASGFRTSYYGDITSRGFYWTSTTINSYSKLVYMDSSSAALNDGWENLTTGLSVRCIKD